jgi:hypothetical protein
VFDGRAGAVSVPVGVRVLLPPPIFVMGTPLLVIEPVSLPERLLPEDADIGREVIVAKVLPSKSEGTVGFGAASSPLKLADPVRVTTDALCDELL